MDSSYEPREDSSLLAEEVKKHAFGDVLDMGTGTGILAQAAGSSDRVDSVLAADINSEAVAITREKGIKTVKSDLFSDIQGRFDTIIFNLPYLPDDPKAKDIALDGGREGYELAVRFLGQAGNHLLKQGIILILFSTLTNVKMIDDAVNRYCFSKEKIASQKLSFEELIVYRLEWIDEIKPLLERELRDIKRLAKGHRGLIFTSVWRGKKITIKVQRKDIDATGTVNNEVVQLLKLNKQGIGPKLLFAGEDHFAYEYIDGEFILPYLEKSGREEVIRVLKEIFDQMRTMDLMGLNKEEMHHPLKHILIGKDGKVVLVDFERCKPSSKVHNITQFCQFIMSGRMKPILDKARIKINKSKLMSAAKEYSNNPDDSNYENIMDMIS